MINEAKLTYFAKTLPELESLLADEIRELGGHDVKIQNRGVYFTANEFEMYRVLAHTRLALRILLPVVEGNVENEQELYELVRSTDWHDRLSLKQTFAVDTVTMHKTMNHSMFLSLKTKDAIVDQFRDKYDIRPDVNPKDPDVQVHVHISQGGFVSVSLDASGHSLNQRGYRVAGGRAPLNEVLAAGLIKMSGWDPDSFFVDPMCGSGTLVIEAALMAKRKAPALLDQEFGIFRWPYFRQALWQHVLDEARSMVVRDVSWIEGGDNDPKALDIARKNIRKARLTHDITLKLRGIDRTFIPEGKGLIMMNPPYGQRIGDKEELRKLYKTIGHTLKYKGRGYTLCVITADPDFKELIPLRPKSSQPVMNGKIKCEFLTFDIS